MSTTTEAALKPRPNKGNRGSLLCHTNPRTVEDVEHKPHTNKEANVKNEKAKKVRHHLVRKHNQIGTKTIHVFCEQEFAAAKTECDRLNEKAAETNPAFRFELITMEA